MLRPQTPPHPPPRAAGRDPPSPHATPSPHAPQPAPSDASTAMESEPPETATAIRAGLSMKKAHCAKCSKCASSPNCAGQSSPTGTPAPASPACASVAAWLPGKRTPTSAKRHAGLGVCPKAPSACPSFSKASRAQRPLRRRPKTPPDRPARRSRFRPSWLNASPRRKCASDVRGPPV